MTPKFAGTPVLPIVLGSIVGEVVTQVLPPLPLPPLISVSTSKVTVRVKRYEEATRAIYYYCSSPYYYCTTLPTSPA